MINAILVIVTLASVNLAFLGLALPKSPTDDLWAAITREIERGYQLDAGQLARAFRSEEPISRDARDSLARLIERGGLVPKKLRVRVDPSARADEQQLVLSLYNTFFEEEARLDEQASKRARGAKTAHYRAAERVVEELERLGRTVVAANTIRSWVRNARHAGRKIRS